MLFIRVKYTDMLDNNIPLLRKHSFKAEVRPPCWIETQDFEILVFL